MNVNKSGGIGLFGLLGVVFIALKLCGVIEWSWWLVTAPFWWWIPLLALILGGMCVYYKLIKGTIIK